MMASIDNSDAAFLSNSTPPEAEPAAPQGAEDIEAAAASDPLLAAPVQMLANVSVAYEVDAARPTSVAKFAHKDAEGVRDTGSPPELDTLARRSNTPARSMRSAKRQP